MLKTDAVATTGGKLTISDATPDRDRFAPTVSVSTHLLEVYLKAASSCARHGCTLCRREAAQLRRELGRRNTIARQWAKTRRPR